MEGKKELSFWDIGNEIENAIAYIEETSEAFDVIFEKMEYEGFQREEKFDNAMAIAFAMNFPRYLATMRVVHRELSRNIAELKAVAKTAFEAYEPMEKAVKV